MDREPGQRHVRRCLDLKEPKGGVSKRQLRAQAGSEPEPGIWKLMLVGAPFPR